MNLLIAALQFAAIINVRLPHRKEGGRSRPRVPNRLYELADEGVRAPTRSESTPHQRGFTA
jgi:hypothetical protein